MTWLRRRHAELDEQVEQALASQERARAEMQLSERRLQRMRAETDPLVRRGQQNQFAEIIRKSLREGAAKRDGRTA